MNNNQDHNLVAKIDIENTLSENNVAVTDSRESNAMQHLIEPPLLPSITDKIGGDNSNKINLDGDCCTLKQILGFDFSELPFDVKGLIPAGCLSLIVGESDIGKSTLHTQLALSIVSGMQKFLGRDINVKHKRVLIVSTEEGISAIGNRIQKQMTKIPVDSNAAERLIILTTSDNITNRIKEILKRTPVDLIIIDAFSDIFHLDMNISNKVRTFFNAYSDLIREFKCSIVFIHHIGKSREGLPLHKNQVLGSVGIVDKVRQALWLSRDKKSSSKRQLTIIKGNYVTDEEKSKALSLNFDSESRTFEFIEEKDIKNSNISPSDDNEKELAEGIHKLRDEGKSRREIEEITGVERTTQWRYQKKYPSKVDIDEHI
jgi:archaellum biogenesis ATPase FlaH